MLLDFCSCMVQGAQNQILDSMGGSTFIASTSCKLDPLAAIIYLSLICSLGTFTCCISFHFCGVCCSGKSTDEANKGTNLPPQLTIYTGTPFLY